MKKGTIIALLVAVILIVAGGVLLMLGLSFAGDVVAAPVQAEKNYVVDAPFESIRVETDTCDVEFQKTDGSFKVSCPESEKYSYTVTVEENTLCIRQVDLRQWYDFIGIYLGEEKITVYLPEETYDALYIETNTGDIGLPDSFTFTSATLVSDTGDVGFAAQVTEELSVTTDTGEIGIQGVSCKVVTCESDTGDKAFRQVQAEQYIRSVSTTGDVTLESCDAGALDIQSSTGDVTLCNVLLTGQMKLRTTTGDVNILSCDADTADIQTSTGDVFGKFLTSKWFHAVSNTGKIIIPMTREGGVCSIITNTGDITFSYSPDQRD